MSSIAHPPRIAPEKLAEVKTAVAGEYDALLEAYTDLRDKLESAQGSANYLKTQAVDNARNIAGEVEVALKRAVIRYTSNADEANDIVTQLKAEATATALDGASENISKAFTSATTHSACR